MSSEQWAWTLVVALVPVVAYLAARLLLAQRRVVSREDMLSTVLPHADLVVKDPDYTVSINDWGPDFEGSDLGRWRWVIWQKVPTGDEAPVELGNAPTAYDAWRAVLSAVLKHWKGEYFKPRLTIEWKKVTSRAEDHS